jgi:hypothetical protein
MSYVRYRVSVIMESNYGIGVNNRYALFFEQDDADGDEVIKAVMAPKPKASAPAAKKDAKPAPSTQTAVKKPETGKPPRGEGGLKHFRLNQGHCCLPQTSQL